MIYIGIGIALAGYFIGNGLRGMFSGPGTEALARAIDGVTKQSEGWRRQLRRGQGTHR